MLHSITNKPLVDHHTQQLPSDDDDTHLATYSVIILRKKLTISEITLLLLLKLKKPSPRILNLTNSDLSP